eukprot:TRINITY_DN5639_c0_g1_i2.p1 TRINITY_DN5639_c0_g1~~TRINITY_DN5639_c0_g1_i2.p1  ORF type:complete len:144 (-),score=39.37 TRINITY_DN5639_c0_g1_i2:82-513(-)
MGWPLSVGPRVDLFNLSENPQVVLRVQNDSGGEGNVWVLLSKHVQDTTEEDSDFVALYWSKSRGGKRVFLRRDTDPDKGRGYQGIYINQPHHLVRMNVPKGLCSYTLLASQSKRQRDLNITICLLYTSPSPRDRTRSRMPSSA